MDQEKVLGKQICLISAVCGHIEEPVTYLEYATFLFCSTVTLASLH